MTARGPLVVVGDTLLDVDIEGSARRLSPEAPVPVVDCRQERHRAGGAGLAAVLAAGLAGAGMAGSGVILVTALGQDAGGQRLRELLARHVEVAALPLCGGTVRKIRVRASGQPVVRLDAGDGRAAPGPAGPDAERALHAAGAVLVCDYGRGVAAHRELSALLARLPADVPVVWDPHPAGTPPAAVTRLATPNRVEARQFAGALPGRPGSARPGPVSPVAQAARDAGRLARAWGTAIAVTMGEAGALLSLGDGVPVLAPAAELDPRLVADTCGAGDAFAAAAAQVLRAGGLLTEAVTEAVRRASDFVGRGGASAAPGMVFPAQRPADAAAGPGAAAVADHRAFEMLARVRARGGKVVATGGCFDLLHAGHVGLLREARRLGDCLVVCLNSDASVTALKGPGRPLVTEQDRAHVLAALEPVDAVLVFDEPTPSQLLERVRPDIWVKGGDYGHAGLAEAAVVRRHGGEVVLLPYLSQHSTSAIVAAARHDPAEPSPAR